MLVELFFCFRSGFIIWPKYYDAVQKSEDTNDVNVYEEVIQSIMAIWVIGGTVYSYLERDGQYQYIKYLLFVQGI